MLLLNIDKSLPFPLKRNSLDLDNKPKAIRFIEYFIIAFFVVSTLIVLIANIFYS